MGKKKSGRPVYPDDQQIEIKLQMKAATISELKQELANSSPSALVELCLRLSRFKKENKELLTYLLFEAHDTESYIKSIKQEIEHQFEGINKSSLYFIKKSLRKIIRTINKYNRYCGLAAVEIETGIYFCELMKDLDLPLANNPALYNIYHNQIKKLNKVISSLHEDLQYDYLKQLKNL